MKSLFGIIESKKEAHDRAKALFDLYASLRDAPEAIACRQSQIAQVQYFIDRSNRSALDPNDLDGMMHHGIDTESILTDADCAAMRRNRKIWKRFPKGWLGTTHCDRYPCKLHHKEVAYLKDVIKETQAELDNIEVNLPLVQDAIQSLRAVGPFSKEIAGRYKLTVDGEDANGKAES